MKKISAIFAAIAALFTVGGCPAAKTQLPPDAILLDVRTEAEFQTRHLPGSILIPHEQIREKAPLQLPDKNAAIVLFCRSGRRSAIAKKTLEKLGYTNVTDLGAIDNAAAVLGIAAVEK